MKVETSTKKLQQNFRLVQLDFKHHVSCASFHSDLEDQIRPTVNPAYSTPIYNYKIEIFAQSICNWP